MQNQIFAIGGAHWDILGRAPQNMSLYDDVGGRIRRMIGGVAGPIAMKLAMMGLPVELLAYAGNDALGDALIAKLNDFRVGTTHMQRGMHPTDVYMGIEAPNGVIAAIADCHSLEAVSEALVENLQTQDLSATTLIIDGNLHADSLTHLAKANLPVKRAFLVPASPGKIHRFQPIAECGNYSLCVNLREANALCHGQFTVAIDAAKALLECGFESALVTNGGEDAAFVSGEIQVTAKPPAIEVKRFTGAGDTMSAHFIYALETQNHPQEALSYALGKTAEFISQEDLDA